MTNLVHLRTFREEGQFEREAKEQHARWSAGVHAGELAEALRREIQGEMRFDRSCRALYATDGSNYLQVPIGVVIRRDIGDVIRTVALARRLWGADFEPRRRVSCVTAPSKAGRRRRK